jgi:hypothetical protein
MAFGEGLGISRETLFGSLLGMPVVAPFLASKRETTIHQERGLPRRPNSINPTEISASYKDSTERTLRF